jgi:HPt (histidine-containing phosphotransfer) domain-containing protein
MDANEEAANSFLQHGYRELMTIVFAIQKQDSDAVADAAQSLASSSMTVGAETLASAARDLMSAARNPRAALETALPIVARAFAEVEAEIRHALDRDVPLFI